MFNGCLSQSVCLPIITQLKLSEKCEVFFTSIWLLEGVKLGHKLTFVKK